ncbi:MFS general substrate transporter [Choiromyces venosus 120613-1]|uniref:MFS general substrate transporter n=1 Tax=Choiromyces venosus 120613-1 TaxID=1336337 RepID=A0A3N4JHQ9_9PEZI|nr:MFS general substrate transporter [Choiromyces venosus 120613-1]
MSTMERNVTDPEKAINSSPSSVPLENMGTGAVLSEAQTRDNGKDVEQATDGDTLSSTSGEEFEVRWVGEDADPGNPRSMNKSQKWLIAWVVSMGGVCVTCTSSMYTSTYRQVTAEFNVPQLAAVGGLALYVAGLGIGPMFLGPLSEFYGRRPIYLVSFSLFTLFLLPCALAWHIAVLLVFRFLTGMAGSAFLSVAGGTMGDMFDKAEVGAPMMLYTASTFMGPGAGPLIGGFINQNANWRWTFWVLMIWSVFMLASLYFFVPETYHPVLLRDRAISLRKSSGDPRYRASIEKTTRSITRTVLGSCTRPFELLIFEPMLLLLCIFTALLLGILYLFFQAFPLVFANVHHFSLQQIGLTFIGLIVGMGLGTLTDPIWRKNYAQLVHKHNNTSQPEFRLPPAIAGGILVPIGLFWFAWTTLPHVHWILPIIGSTFFGMGTLLVFSGIFTFTVEAYPVYAASALAANSFVRSAFAAGFPLFSTGMYKRLGYQWASSLLGFLSLLIAPIMVCFFIWGERIRARSRFATVRG